MAYKKRTSSKAVKKTLSIPEWLNEEATSMGINFSQVLQEALISKLPILFHSGKYLLYISFKSKISCCKIQQINSDKY